MSGAAPLVLVVEDERPIRTFLRATLRSHSYRVAEVETGQSALAAAAEVLPDLVILDLGLPDMDGLGVIDRLREWSSTPIIVLSARGREQDKVAALDRGADDYLTKPFGVKELLARLRVALRNRSRPPGAPPLEPAFQVGGLHIDLVKRRVSLDGRPVHLTPIEYRLLTTFARHAGKVLTHRFLLQEVWGPAHSDDARYVRVFLAHLRRKIEVDPSQPRYLLTEQGVGYRLVDE